MPDRIKKSESFRVEKPNKTVGIVIVAAGVGSRAGGNLPKQYRSICGKTVLYHTVKAFSSRVKSTIR